MGGYLRKLDAINLPGNFFVLNDAFVIIDLDMVTIVGVMATLMPIGPSLGWPKTRWNLNYYFWFDLNIIGNVGRFYLMDLRVMNSLLHL